MKNFINLHTHTVGSFLDGHGQMNAYMKRAAELGMSALAITDHGNLHMALDFYEAGQEHGVKPIIGMEAYQARKTRFDRDEEERAGGATDELEQRGPYHLTVLARNLTGYKNLIKLSSRAFLEGFYGNPRIDYELLEEHAEGLTVLSGCLNGAVSQALMRNDFNAALTLAAKMQDIIGKDYYYIEVMDHGIPEELEVLPQLVEIASRIGAKVVATGDSHYVYREDSRKHDLALCVSTSSTVDEEDRFKFVPEEFYLKSYEEMEKRFDPRWLKNTLEIGESVDLNLEFGDLFFPEFDIPNNEPLKPYFERSVWEGIKSRYGDPIPDDVRERTEYELRVIHQMGFEGYFLVLSDIVGWAKSNGIFVGPGRGSAAGSIVSFALKITNLDPLYYGLLFERFLVEGRKSPPDIDIDIDDRYRDRVIDYARTKYGEDRVAHICTFARVGGRSAIRDAARVLGYEYAVGDKLAKLVPEPMQGFARPLKDYLNTTDSLREAYQTEENKEVIDAALGLEGIYRQTGIHAGGIVIGKSSISDYVPVMRKGDDSPIVTQWDMNRVEQNGLLKADFLGLRNLGVIDECIKNIKEYRNIDIDIDAIPRDDKATFEMLCEGKTQGVFQMEGGGLTRITVELQPESIEDIMALIALYRPGPLGSGMHKMYIERKHGRESVSYPHPLLEEILQETYGTLLYQENILAIAKVLAGFTPLQCDDLRKATGKKIPEQMAKMKDLFIQGCKDTNGISEKLARDIFSDIEYFAAYGFNKPHSASYAVISYQTAYLKCHYPTEYMAALLSSVDDKAERAIPYLNECRSMGINVLSPSINRSRYNFKVESDDEILFGLSSIKGIGSAVANYILNGRPSNGYSSIYDFMRKCNPELLNKAILEHLSRAGAFDELVPPQESRPLDRPEKMDILDLEKDELGFYITENPLVGVWHLLEPDITTTIADLETHVDGETVTVGGILTKADKFTTKRGQTMYTLTLEDLTGSAEVLVFPAAVRNNVFESGEIVLITGRVAQDGDDEHIISKIFFSSIVRPDLPQHAVEKPIVISCSSQPTYDMISNMIGLIKSNPGDSPVYIEFPENNIEVTLRFDKFVNNKIEQDLKLLGRTVV